MPLFNPAGSGTVTGVTAADTSIVIGGTAAAPTVATATLDVIAADHAPAANWSNNSHKITSLANGSAGGDAAAFGQTLAGGTGTPLTTAGDTLIMNATPAPARLPLGSAGPPVQVLGQSGALPAWVNPNLAGVFGDGSDGAVTFDGSTTILGLVPAGNVYTMNRDIFCTAITINNGVTVKPNNFKIFCAGTITNNGTIGVAGTAGQAGGTGGAGGSAGTLTNPSGGANGTTTAGGNATTRSTPGTGASGAGGTGGASGNGSAGTGGGGSAATTVYKAGPYTTLVNPGTTSIIGGATGGGGGGGDGTTSGGGGGSGGTSVVIYAWVLNNGSGTINTSGGAGGSPSSGTNPAGGGGGGGGLILAFTLTAWTAGTMTLSGGALGSGRGTGGNGVAGSAGTAVNVVLS